MSTYIFTNYKTIDITQCPCAYYIDNSAVVCLQINHMNFVSKLSTRWTSEALTCFPQRRSLLIIGVESFCKSVGFQQTIKEFEELLRCEEAIHALILSVNMDIKMNSVPL